MLCKTDPQTKILKLRNLITDYSAQDLVRGKQTKTVPNKNKKRVKTMGDLGYEVVTTADPQILAIDEILNDLE